MESSVSHRIGAGRPLSLQHVHISEQPLHDPNRLTCVDFGTTLQNCNRLTCADSGTIGLLVSFATSSGPRAESTATAV